MAGEFSFLSRECEQEHSISVAPSLFPIDGYSLEILLSSQETVMKEGERGTGKVCLFCDGFSGYDLLRGTIGNAGMRKSIFSTKIL